jgi:hypothetical protein
VGLKAKDWHRQDGASWAAMLSGLSTPERQVPSPGSSTLGMLAHPLGSSLVQPCCVGATQLALSPEVYRPSVLSEVTHSNQREKASSLNEGFARAHLAHLFPSKRNWSSLSSSNYLLSFRSRVAAPLPVNTLQTVSPHPSSLLLPSGSLFLC